MNARADALKARTKQFALDVLAFVTASNFGEPAASVGRQLVRAGTSVGANYRSACRARSTAEFAARIGVVLEEADESLFWLEVIKEGHLGSGPTLHQLLNEAGELTAIFAASSITARANLKS
jgi:four helix bundle protein